MTTAVEPGTTPEADWAVSAWREISGAEHHVSVTPMTGGRHATTLALAAPAGPPVVAKIRPSGQLDLERALHQRVLPELDLPTPDFLGFIRGSAGRGDVLFLSHVGDRRFQPTRSGHRQAAARWLGSCHARSAALDLPPEIPRVSLTDARRVIVCVRDELARVVTNPALASEGSTSVRSVVCLLDGVIGSWRELTEDLAGVPDVLTHGAFITRNVRVRGSGRATSVVPFDWDHVAIASPAIDLAHSPLPIDGFGANADPVAYGDRLAREGAGVHEKTVRGLVCVGTVIRAARCAGWLVPALGSDRTRRAVRKLTTYESSLAWSLAS